LPDPIISGKGAMIYVTSSNGETYMAVSNGAEWRRIIDAPIA